MAIDLGTWSQGASIVDERTINGGRVSTWLAPQARDSWWDGWLCNSGVGQYQQSTYWASMKQSQGWKIARVIIALGDEPVVGFHLLWRHSLLGRVGYVSKAPVIIPADPSLVHHAIGMLCAISRRMRLRALIVQPPDSDRQIET